MSLRKFIETAKKNWITTHFHVQVQSNVEFPFEIEPREFLKFAEQDLKTGGLHGFTNALSNAKRAIDCQIEGILYSFALEKKHRNFPNKLEIICGMGLAAPRIIKKINALRNILEHEFKMPSQEKVEDAVDTATLFLEATNRIFAMFPMNFCLCGEFDCIEPDCVQDNTLEFKLHTADGIIKIKGYCDDFGIIEQDLKPTDPFYIDILRLAVKCDFNYSIYSEQETVDEFFNKVMES